MITKDLYYYENFLWEFSSTDILCLTISNWSVAEAKYKNFYNLNTKLFPFLFITVPSSFWRSWPWLFCVPAATSRRLWFLWLFSCGWYWPFPPLCWRITQRSTVSSARWGRRRGWGKWWQWFTAFFLPFYRSWSPDRWEKVALIYLITKSRSSQRLKKLLRNVHQSSPLGSIGTDWISNPTSLVWSRFSSWQFTSVFEMTFNVDIGVKPKTNHGCY